jgi:hypothetical protein
VSYGRFFSNLKHATTYLYRRRTRPGGPRSLQSTDIVSPSSGHRHHHVPAAAVAELIVLAIPPCLASALGLWTLHESVTHPPQSYSDQVLGILFAFVTIALTVRAASAPARIWVRAVGTLLGSAYVAGVFVALTGAWPA